MFFNATKSTTSNYELPSVQTLNWDAAEDSFYTGSEEHRVRTTKGRAENYPQVTEPKKRTQEVKLKQ